MRDLSEIQAIDALTAIKRRRDFDRESYLMARDDTGPEHLTDYLSHYLDPHQADCMSPAGWRVLDAWIVAGR